MIEDPLFFGGRINYSFSKNIPKYISLKTIFLFKYFFCKKKN